MLESCFEDGKHPLSAHIIVTLPSMLPGESVRWVWLIQYGNRQESHGMLIAWKPQVTKASIVHSLKHTLGRQVYQQKCKQ